MFVCQMLNNSETEELTPLQSIALLVKFLVMVLIVLESFILCFQIRHNKTMKKLGQARYRKAKETSRRRTWGNKSAVVALAALALFIVAIVVGVFVGPDRACKGGTVLETAVCVPCEQPGCVDCQTSGSKKCD